MGSVSEAVPQTPVVLLSASELESEYDRLIQWGMLVEETMGDAYEAPQYEDMRNYYLSPYLQHNPEEIVPRLQAVDGELGIRGVLGEN